MHLFLQGHNVYLLIHVVSHRMKKTCSVAVYPGAVNASVCQTTGCLHGNVWITFMFLPVEFRQRQEGCALRVVMRKKEGKMPQRLVPGFLWLQSCTP